MAHVHDSIDIVSVAYIVNKDKVLLILHKQLNMWLPIGGHVEHDEDPEAALFREVKEECGLDIEVMSSKPNIEAKGTKFLYTPESVIYKILDTRPSIGFVYFAKAKSNKIIFNEAEHKDIKWFSLGDLKRPEFSLLDEVKFFSKEALKKISNK